jgi:plastocyanin
MFVIALIIGGGAVAMILGAVSQQSSSTTTTQGTTTTAVPQTVVNLVIVPDYGGSTYDAFVLSTNLECSAVPTAATNSTGPGLNDNNITVSSGTSVKFVVTDIDTAVNQNYSSKLSTPFTVYNDTNSGVISSQYSAGQSVAMMEMAHTFSIPQLGVLVPMPPDTIIEFSLTFSTPGVYLYTCITPCGSGMGIFGYMEGYVIVN